MIVFAAIMPHPLESVPGIGNPDGFLAIKKTLKSFEELRIGLERANPDTILIISPHAQMEEYSFVINSDDDLSGDLSKFGSSKVYRYDNNIEIVNKLSFTCKMNDSMSGGTENGIPIKLRAYSLDHGAIIPLYHLTKNIKPRIVHLSFSLMSYKSHYNYGEVIQKIIENADDDRPCPGYDPGRIAVIASADLSHSLNKNSPAGYSPKAQDFDHAIVRYLGSNDLASLMGLEEEDAMEAHECGIRSIMILMGILHGKEYKFNLLSYEGPSGIGYLTARLI